MPRRWGQLDSCKHIKKIGEGARKRFPELQPEEK
jgi:hypothetical protein